MGYFLIYYSSKSPSDHPWLKIQKSARWRFEAFK